MKTTMQTRLIGGLALALSLALSAAALATAAPEADFPSEEGPACAGCHEPTYSAWQSGGHGLAAQQSSFLKVWQEQGAPSSCLSCHSAGADPTTGAAHQVGVTCESCHGELVEGHPEEPMTIDRSAENCSRCHGNTSMEWMASGHNEFSGGCISCHDPHAARILVDEPSSLCTTCHQARTTGFGHEVHDQAGLTCASCHLDGPFDDIDQLHSARDHSLNVHLDSCTNCHAFDPSTADASVTAAEAKAPGESASPALQTHPEPAPASPIGAAAIVGVFGFAGGVLLTRWLGAIYRRSRED